MNCSSRLPRRILLASVGSYGDVFPFLSLGKLLVQRGYEVSFLTSGYFTQWVQQAGMQMVPVGTAEEYQAYVSNPDLLHPLKGLWLTRKILNSILEPIYNYICREWWTPGSLIIASPYCVAARIARETLDCRLLTLNIAPISLGSNLDPPTISPWISPQHIPRSLRFLFGRMVHWVTDQILGRSVNAFRRKLGLKRVHQLMQWWHSPDGSYSLFTDWFAAAKADWPKQHRYLGFPECRSEPSQLDPDLNNFLADYPQTLLFYPGSNASRLHAYMQVCRETCERLGCGGILVAPAALDVPRKLDKHMYVSSFLPMQAVLPRVRAAVHHGGIGTVADCLAAGVPQLIRPVFADQPDNATRIRALGVGDWLSVNQFHASGVSSRLKSLLADEQVAEKCRVFQHRMRQSHGLTALGDALESSGI